MKSVLLTNGMNGRVPSAGSRDDKRKQANGDVTQRGQDGSVSRDGRGTPAWKKLLQSAEIDDLVDYSDDDDTDDVSLASGDEEQRESNFAPATNYWADFDNSIKNINDSTQFFALKPKPNFKSSCDFKGVMTDMFGNTEYGTTRSYTKLKEKINRLTNVSGLASRMLSRVVAANEPAVDLEEPEDEDDEKKAKADQKSELIGAKRSWKLIKRHVQEAALEKKTEKTKMNWDMVSHHVKGMTDLERARDDLYKRYGVIPTVQKDGKYECRNVMWSERAIRLNQTNPGQYNVYSHTKNKKRTQSARPMRSTTDSKLNSAVKPRPASETRIISSRIVSSGVKNGVISDKNLTNGVVSRSSTSNSSTSKRPTTAVGKQVKLGQGKHVKLSWT